MKAAVNEQYGSPDIVHIRDIPAPKPKAGEILIEVNANREPQKSGVLPEAATDLIREIARLEGVQIRGLMTMGALAEKSTKPAVSASKNRRKKKKKRR